MEQCYSWEANGHSASQEIACLLWTGQFITVFTTALQWPLFWARCIQSTPYPPVSLRYILISSHLHLDRVVSSLQVFLPKLFTHFSSTCMLHVLASSFPWLYHPNSIWWHKLWRSSLTSLHQTLTTPSFLGPNILSNLLYDLGWCDD
jgi:hypothetical protein